MERGAVALHCQTNGISLVWADSSRSALAQDAATRDLPLFAGTSGRRKAVAAWELFGVLTNCVGEVDGLLVDQ